MKKYFVVLLATWLFVCSCQSNHKRYESRHQAAYEYLNNCKNLTFWKADICDEKYKDLFPINIVPQVFPNLGGDVELKRLIAQMPGSNRKSDLYVVFSSGYDGIIKAMLLECQFDEANPLSMSPEAYIANISAGFLLPEADFLFTFNTDNSIKMVSKGTYEGIEL